MDDLFQRIPAWLQRRAADEMVLMGTLCTDTAALLIEHGVDVSTVEEDARKYAERNEMEEA